jgi:hypothetical protein
VCTKFYVELGMMYLNLEMEKKASPMYYSIWIVCLIKTEQFL